MALQTIDRRRLGLPSATALVVGNMIGFGVFTTSGYALADLGTPARVLAAWAVGGMLAMLGAISYGALAARISESGGEYLFLSKTIHPFLGFLAGWVSLLAGFTAPIAAAAAVLQAYCRAPLLAGMPPQVVGTAAILLAGLLHGVRLTGGVRLQNTVVVIKLALIVGLITYAMPQLPSLAVSEAPDFELSRFARSLVWISLSYSGWNAAVYVGGEVRNPTSNLPRSLVWGTTVVIILYLLLNTLFVYAAPVAKLAGEAAIAAVAMDAIGGPGLARFVSVVVAIALFTSISAMVMAGPRVYARMADDGVLPRALGTRGEVPSVAILLQVALSIVVLWSAELSRLLGYIGWTLSISTAITVIGLMYLRKREGAQRVPIPGWPWLPLLFVVATFAVGIFMMLQSPWEPLVGLLTLACGALVYGLLRKRHRASGPPANCSAAGPGSARP